MAIEAFYHFLTVADIPSLQGALVAALRRGDYAAMKAIAVALSTIEEG